MRKGGNPSIHGIVRCSGMDSRFRGNDIGAVKTSGGWYEGGYEPNPSGLGAGERTASCAFWCLQKVLAPVPEYSAIINVQSSLGAGPSRRVSHFSISGLSCASGKY